MGKILLVDDDKATNFYNRYILQKNQITCDIIVLDNGLKAMEFLKNVAIPDVIFLDINMPVMDGIEFLEEAQKWAGEKFDKVRVFVMMSVSLSEDKMQRLHGIRKVEIIKSKVLTSIDIENFCSKVQKF